MDFGGITKAHVFDPEMLYLPNPGVQPHKEALDWVIKDDSTGRYVSNPTSMDAQVVEFMNEDLH